MRLAIVARAVPPPPVERITRILGACDAALAVHAHDCGDRVLAIALNPHDHDLLCIAEIWGLPVLAWGAVERDRMRLLCEAEGTLIPRIDTYEELLERWTFHLERV
jgi:hypothetical protein